MTVTHERRATPDALLATVPLFSDLGAKTLARIARSSIQLAVDGGTVLFERGEPCNGLYGIVSGRVKLSLPSEGGGEKVVTLVGPGQTFAESAAFLDEPHLLSAQTLTASQLVHVRKHALPMCLKADPQFATRVVQTLSRRVQELITHVENSTTLSGTQRVVDFLLSELRDESGDGPSTIALPAKKRIIASRLDLTQEHFSRILHELTVANLLVVQGSALTVSSIEKLRAYRKASRQCGKPRTRGAHGRATAPRHNLNQIRVAVGRFNIESQIILSTGEMMVRILGAAMLFAAMCAVTADVLSQPAAASRTGSAPETATSAATLTVYKNAQ